MTKESTPPAELVAQCEELNKWLDVRFKVIPHFYQDSYGDTWQFQIVEVNLNLVIVSHLDPAHAHGHTYRMLCSAVLTAHQRGVAEGLRLALLRQFEDMCKRVGVPQSVAKQTLGIHQDTK